MPYSTIRQLPDVRAADGVLIRRASLHEAARADNLMREAKRRAHDLIRDADREADACRLHAATAGYEAGFRQVVALVTDYLERCRQRQLALRERVVDDVQRALQQFLSEPELMLSLAEAFASHRGSHREGSTDVPVLVSIPHHAKRIAPAVRRNLAQTYPAVQVMCSDSPAFIVQWGDEIVEFDPRAIAQELTAGALASCEAASAAIDDDALARQVIADALHRLGGDIDNTLPTDHEKESSDDPLGTHAD
jgi:hypothetical protein